MQGEIQTETQEYLENNYNKNTTHGNLWKIAKSEFRGKIIASNTSLTKKGKREM